jgi:SOS-response transcriptional repressor LexA
MEEDQPLSTVRPTMRQQQLLEFIAAFIAEHGYSPSYREVMKGCNYNSVATAAQ